MKSIKEKLEDLVERVHEDDFKNEWAFNFVNSVRAQAARLGGTEHLTDKQVEKIDELWEKYCG